MRTIAKYKHNVTVITYTWLFLPTLSSTRHLFVKPALLFSFVVLQKHKLGHGQVSDGINHHFVLGEAVFYSTCHRWKLFNLSHACECAYTAHPFKA
ncbi:hypothetical protein BCR41DRAFT_226673 [Lobosporangium transversale]|uniref:Uncharacterized protein n=1 Tax=Lobosporangium transversale TaxID=64571 RepID=A0A1Y2GAL0_9FUNG|nr:hypothetical protein BCR41DRAFT_226673 [Lobosporangium transversale]ORY98324.1 hypothetical protein BCR41DRAFT_226673 [Lobosporangium transversale]|eukprot:XP_021875735.1 hypothetical protein BCR41DRAFT_226673 [Lobosporangium transversale]